MSLAALWCIGAVIVALGLPLLLPLHFATLGTLCVVLVGGVVVSARARRAFDACLARVEAVKGVRSGRERSSLSDPGKQLEDLNRDLTVDLEESYFRLIKTNIQLLSLKEVGRSIIASLDGKRTVESVLDYLQRGIGFSEYGLFTWRAEDGVFEGGVRRRSQDGFEWVAQTFAPHESSGMLAKSLGQQRSCLIKDAHLHDVGSVVGQPLFPGQTHRSFVIVPLVRTAPGSATWSRAEDGCPDCADPSLPAWLQAYGRPLMLAEAPRCWRCSGSPVLGCIVATDAGRDQALSKVDLIMLETLAQHLSTVLENSQLYEDLRREERFRENVIGGLSNGLVSIDLDGRVTLLNEAAERISGHQEAELRGQPGDGLILDARGNDALREALASGRGAHSLEAVLRTSSGGSVPIQLTTSLLRDDEGDIYGVIGEFADLSMLKRMEAQIRHLDKLAALGRFTSSIAHEIRNPLAGITAGIQYMTRGFQGAEAEHVGFILAEVERLNRIIGDLFDAGRPLHLHPQPTDLLDLVHRSVRALQPRFDERGVRVHVSAGADIPAIDVDADRIEQVLINLVQNAIDVSPQGSAVDIELRLGCSREPFAAEPDGELDSLVVSIDDKGEGIAEEDRDKIFEPFYTTKARGTGLGLYVCHHIVEGHGGQIVVNSQPGQGSRFLLFLPVGRSLMGGSRETADLARR